jgi:hypothetical protein
MKMQHEKASPRKRRGFFKVEARRLTLDNLAAFDAGGANAHLPRVGADFGFDGAQIYVPAAARDIVRMRDVVTELRTFLANCTYLRHNVCSRKRIK